MYYPVYFTCFCKSNVKCFQLNETNDYNFAKGSYQRAENSLLFCFMLIYNNCATLKTVKLTLIIESFEQIEMIISKSW